MIHKFQYAHHPLLERCNRMPPPIRVNFTDNLPTNLPRPSALRLPVELIPATTAGQNLRSILTHEQWNVLRHVVYSKAGYRCDACNEGNTQVHCHEVWGYDDGKHVQKLTGLRCLCWECHEATHMLHTTGTLFWLDVKHLARVNCITRRKARKIVRKAMEQVFERSKHEWTIDVSWLDSYLQKEASSDSG